jgi:hypothetical protein
MKRIELFRRFELESPLGVLHLPFTAIVLRPVALCLITVMSPPFPRLSVIVKGAFFVVLYLIFLVSLYYYSTNFFYKKQNPGAYSPGFPTKIKKYTFNDKNERKMSMNYMSNTITFSI